MYVGLYWSRYQVDPYVIGWDANLHQTDAWEHSIWGGASMRHCWTAATGPVGLSENKKKGICLYFERVQPLMAAVRPS